MQVKQDELATQEQELLKTVDEEDEDENEKMRRSLGALLERNTPRRECVPLGEEIALPDMTNEQLQAELDRMWRLWQIDNSEGNKAS